jgi:hypothetical protein
MILQPLYLDRTARARAPYLMYAERLDITGKDAVSGFFNLRRAERTRQGREHSRMGDIVPLNRLQAAVDIAPKHGPNGAHPQLNHAIVMESSGHFVLNHFYSPDFFYNFHFE